MKVQIVCNLITQSESEVSITALLQRRAEIVDGRISRAVNCRLEMAYCRMGDGGFQSAQGDRRMEMICHASHNGAILLYFAIIEQALFYRMLFNFPELSV